MAQEIRLGFKAGVPATAYFETGRSGSLHGSADYSAATRRYVAGPSAEWQITNRFGFELDALYHRMGYVAIVEFFDSASGAGSRSAVDVKGNSWDFPLMAKYRLGRAFAAGGGTLRYAGPVRGRGTLITYNLAAGTSTETTVDTSDPSELRKRLYPGLTAGAGLELRAGRLRLLPEIRYTHWTANISGPRGVLRLAPNQAEVLLGVLF